MSNDDFFYCQKPSDRLSINYNKKIPNNIEPSSLVEFGTGSSQYFVPVIDAEGRESGRKVLLVLNHQYLGFVIRVDLLRSYADLICGDELWRVHMVLNSWMTLLDTTITDPFFLSPW